MILTRSLREQATASIAVPEASPSPLNTGVAPFLNFRTRSLLLSIFLLQHASYAYISCSSLPVIAEWRVRSQLWIKLYDLRECGCFELLHTPLRSYSYKQWGWCSLSFYHLCVWRETFLVSFEKASSLFLWLNLQASVRCWPFSLSQIWTCFCHEDELFLSLG